MQNSAGTAGAALRLGAVEWGLIALQSMLWGSSYFFIALVQAEVPALTMAALRTIPAAAALLLIVLSLGYRLPATLAEWRLFIGFSAFNTVLPFLLIVWGQSRATGGMAAILNATAPLFGIFLAHVLTHDEKLSWSKVAGIVVGIAGVVVLMGLHVRAGASADLVARLALIASPFCYVCANIFARRRLGSYPPFVIAAMQMLGAMFVAAPLALAIDRPWEQPVPSARALGAIVGMGVLGSALASLCHFTVLQRAGATNASLVTLIMPLTPIMLGGLFLGERLSTTDLAGALIIATALLLIDGRAFAALYRAVRGL
ncbi:MAG: DMT family transporter [Hyphomicrobiaceae bacterium]|nr:DMT family transporter [Hyphomicrobiaceae bacterium]